MDKRKKAATTLSKQCCVTLTSQMDFDRRYGTSIPPYVTLLGIGCRIKVKEKIGDTVCQTAYNKEV